jgi:polyribonucleotide nucleotidyltransferase
MTGECRIERQIGGRTLSLETGRIARQADGAVMVRYGDTVVLVTAVTAPSQFEEVDYFPLSVEYREKQSAAGKFPGGFIKREGRPSTKETLTSRLIDRPLRPLFPDGYFQEVQIIATVLSADQDNDPDVPAMIGASAALAISKIPLLMPIGACRVGRIDGQFIINPTHKQMEDSDVKILVGGQKEAINMIEVGAKEVSEQVIAEGVAAAHGAVAEICEMIEELRQKVGVEKEIPLVEIPPGLCEEIRAGVLDRLYEIKQIPDKQQRNTAIEQLLAELEAKYCSVVAEPQGAGANAPRCDKTVLKLAFEKAEEQAVRKLLLSGKRPDGRDCKTIRSISCDVGILPRTHGSAVFTRGETQAIVTVTLGTISDAQIVDGLQDEYTQNFTLHYNFPPFSVGEVRPVRGPSRREIGHGALAEKALEFVRPPEDQFAYTVRVVSDITESNGSSSMATVCGGTLALMDAGVPIARPVAGISIGLVTDETGRYKLLTDIIGEEDRFGDMDFKVAGTEKGITAIQLDIKSRGLAHNVMVEALELARQARVDILKVMTATISEPRPSISVYAPKLLTMEIDPDLIGRVIGPGGRVIKGLQEQTGTTIEIEDDGTVYISCVGGDGHLKAKELIEGMVEPPKVDRVYPHAKVVTVKDFGVFVEITPGVEGLCHISELSDGYVKNVEEVCKVGDEIPVKLILVDEQGRYKFSRKAAMLEMGITDKGKRPEAPARHENKPNRPGHRR